MQNNNKLTILKTNIMKLKSLKNVEVINKEVLDLVNGGIQIADSQTADVSSTSGDSVSKD